MNGRSLLRYDLRNLVVKAPKLSLAILISAPPLVCVWLVLAISTALPPSATMTVLGVLLGVSLLTAGLVIATFEETPWFVVFIEILLVFYYFSAIWKLIQVVRGKRPMPRLN